MKLHTLHDSLAYLERRVNQIRHSSTADYSEVSREFHPKHGEPSFTLPVFSIPKGDVRILTASPSKSARALVPPRATSVPFYCHPDSLRDFKGDAFSAPARYLTAVPSASTRTLFVKEFPEVMLKTHLNKRISHFVRRLSGSSVEHSVRISRECGRLAALPTCPDAFAYLPESIGVIYKPRGLGYLVRELTPRPLVPQKRILIPFFSLYSRDVEGADPPILTQLITRSRKTPLYFFEEEILERFFESWAFAFKEGGLLFESHGQNTLLELTETFEVTRIVQRDFQSVPIDPAIRLRLGLTTPFKKHVIGTGDYPRLIEHSLQYDRFVGHCMLRAFVDFFKAEYAIEEEETRQLIRRAFRRHIPKEMEREFFPQGYFTLGEPSGENLYTLMYYPEKPLYRPGY